MEHHLELNFYIKMAVGGGATFAYYAHHTLPLLFLLVWNKNKQTSWHGAITR
jgi:hypothetical protein